MILEKVTEILSEKLDCEPTEITPDTEFSTLGIDSLDITEILMDLEDEFSVSLEMDPSLQKVSDLVAKIEGEMKA